VQQSGLDRVVVQLPGVQDTARPRIFSAVRDPEVRMWMRSTATARRCRRRSAGQVPFGDELLYDREGVPLSAQSAK